jgi:hypothetical protein
MPTPRLDPDVPDAPVVGAAVTGDMHAQVMELAGQMGSVSAAVRELLRLGLAVLDGEGAEARG